MMIDEMMLPLPTLPITVRPGTLDDLAFVDALQKKHSKQVGWMPTKTLEGKIKAGHVLVAVDATSSSRAVDETSSSRAVDETSSSRAVDETSSSRAVDETSSSRAVEDAGQAAGTPLLLPEQAAGTPLLPSEQAAGTPLLRLGYCIGNDQYFKRDDVGIIYQMNVVPGRQRGLIGATLLKAQFERSAYGCKLYCCWCAQDIEANKFWEAMGFVALAFRAGSRAKDRTHIFWQKRIRAGDTTTPWWYPSQTTGGSIREDRLVLPIPLGVCWDAIMPRLLPECTGDEASDALPALEAATPSSPSTRSARVLRATEKVPVVPRGLRKQPRNLLSNTLRFADPVVATLKPVAPVKRAAKRKNNPQHVAIARELRDRYLEQINADGNALEPSARYVISRTISDGRGGDRESEQFTIEQGPTLALPAQLAA